MSGSKARIEYMRDAFRRRTYTIAKTVADYHSKIDIDETAPVIRSVSIICTIGEYFFQIKCRKPFSLVPFNFIIFMHFSSLRWFICISM